MSDLYQSLSHSRWDCKYHVVFVPKRRRRCCLERRVGNWEKSAIAVARLCGKERNFTGEHLWARGYAVSTIGFELQQVRQYIREQEEADGTGGQF